MDTTGYLAGGIFLVLFGAYAILGRRYAVRTNRGFRELLARVGLRPAPDRDYELVGAWGGAAALVAGTALIIAAVVTLV